MHIHKPGTAKGMPWLRPALTLAALGVASLLAGCHGVVSDRPWFTRNDAASAPRLREGIWLGSSSLSSPCDLDPRKPIAAWPDCADPIVVGRSGFVEVTRDHGRPKRTSASYVLAAGQPLIVQIGDSRGEKPLYEYMWVRVTSLDDQGRVTGLAGWRVFCNGPAAGSLYPGLVGRDGDCTAGSVDALRAAAKATAVDTNGIAQLHWVRDGAK